MRRLFEWGVATERGGQRTLSPVGITDAEPLARARMLEALDEVPDGIPARGWVTVVRYVPGLNIYDRYHTPVRAERDPGGAVRMCSAAVMTDFAPAAGRGVPGRISQAQAGRIGSLPGC